MLRANVFVTIPPVSNGSGLPQRADISEIAAGASGIYATIYASPFGTIDSATLLKFPLVDCHPLNPYSIKMSPQAQDKVSFNTDVFPGARVIFGAYVHYLCVSPTRDRTYFEHPFLFSPEVESESYLLADGRLQKLKIDGR